MYIIINEIQYWREHKLLPEHYCDFLLALYTQGSEDSENVIEQTSRKKNVLFVAQFALLTIMIPLSFLVSYSTKFTYNLQMIFSGLLCLISIVLYFVYKKRSNELYHFALIISLIVLLLTSFTILSPYLSSNLHTLIIISINILLWILIAFKQRLLYLKITSISALIFMVIYILL